MGEDSGKKGPPGLRDRSTRVVKLRPGALPVVSWRRKQTGSTALRPLSEQCRLWKQDGHPLPGPSLSTALPRIQTPSQDLRPLVNSALERQRSNFRTPPGHRSHTHPLVAAQDLKATLTKDQHLGEVRNFLQRMPAGYWRVTHHHRRDPPDEGCVFTARRLLIHCLALATPASPWGAPS